MYSLCLLLLMWLFSPRIRWLRIQGSQFFSKLLAINEESLVDAISLNRICYTFDNIELSRLLLTNSVSMFNKYYYFYLIFASFCQKNKRVNTDISAVCWSAGAFSQIKFNLSLDVVLSLSKDTLVKHLPQLFISSMCSQLRKMGSVMEQFSKVNFFWLITNVVQWNHNITKGQGQATGRICLLYKVALYWGSFSFILLLLGYWKSFVIPRTFVMWRFYCCKSFNALVI